MHTAQHLNGKIPNPKLESGIKAENKERHVLIIHGGGVVNLRFLKDSFLVQDE